MTDALNHPDLILHMRELIKKMETGDIDSGNLRMDLLAIPVPTSIGFPRPNETRPAIRKWCLFLEERTEIDAQLHESLLRTGNEA